MSRSHEIVRRHLAEQPVFLAMLRSIEHRLVAERQPFDRPLIDVGAGDGQFAAAALAAPVDVGIDPSPARMHEAVRRRAYRHLIRASATALPFPDGTFATAICNCVIEHISDPHKALAEMFRTLRPGGALLMTVPMRRFERNLPVAKALRTVGFLDLARRYLTWFRKIQAHYHVFTRQQWAAAVTDAGFRIARLRGYLSARATAWFEFWHYAEWPSLVSRALTGRWVVGPRWARFALLEGLLARFVEEPEHDDDSCLFIAARKP